MLPPQSPFPETDQRSAIPADAGYKPDANSLDAGTAKRRRAQTSDEAAEAEQLRSQKTALPLARTAVTFESKIDFSRIASTSVP